MSFKKESRLESLLHSHAKKGDIEGIKQVLDTGRVNVDSKDQEGTTPLIFAAGCGKADCVKILLDEGADPNIKKLNGVSAIFLGSQAGYMDIVSMLLTAGGDPDPVSMDGGTPLMAACQAGHFDVVQVLVSKGAKVNSAMWQDGAGPLFLAAQNGHTREVVFLLGVEGVIVDQQRRDGASPLWIAAQMGHDDIVRLLVKAGASVDLPRADGATALFKACHKGYKDVIRELLLRNPNLGLLQNGETCMHAAALSGQLDVVNQLLMAGADPDQVNLSGLTALDVAKGKVKERLGHITNRTTDAAILANTANFSRSLTPDKLSALKNVSSLRNSIGSLNTKRDIAPPESPLISHQSSQSLLSSYQNFYSPLNPYQNFQSPLIFHQNSQSPLASHQNSPVRSAMTRFPKSPSTSPATPTSSAPSITPKHSVHFTDPILYKDGVIVTKVQCKIMEARELVCREKSPVRYINLSRKSRDFSPIRLCSLSPAQSLSTSSSITSSSRTH